MYIVTLRMADTAGFPLFCSYQLPPMKNIFFTTWMLCLLGGLVISCSNMKEPEFRSIENGKLTMMGLSDAVLAADIHYFNPNNTRLKLKRAEGDAYLEGNLLGHFVVDSLIHIPAGSAFYIPVKLKVEMKHLAKNSLAVYLNKEVSVKLEGKARIGKSIFFINYPIFYEGKQNLAELLK